MNVSRSFRLVLFVAVNFLFNCPADAGVVKRSIRMVREVYPPDVEPENEANQPQVCIVGDVVYGADETVPAEQPCLKCRCQPPGVQCETVQCAKKPGCKAIHRPNKCCPDYQCECEHEGKIYANGEKLETNPGGECKVCYCRGGEVQCAEVSCYIRNDCEGKRVPGTCCPKYDHCPPIDAVLDRSPVVTEPPLNTLKPVTSELWQETNTTEVPFTPNLNSIPEDSNKVPDTSYAVTISPSFEEISNKEELHPRITIQEIIPERKEIPITAPPKIYISEPQGTLLIEEALPTSENTSNDLTIDSEPESSEVSEVFQHPPPVLRIGDKLLFLKKGDLVPEKDTSTPDSIITIIGAEGLQRGGVEESLEVHEVKIEPETRVQDVNVDVSGEEEQNILNNTDNGVETSYEPFNLTKDVEEPSGTGETNELELKPAESTHILSLVKRKDKTITTTSTQAPTTQKEALTTLSGSIEEPRQFENQSTEANAEATSTILPVVVSTTTLPSTTELQIKNTEPIVEQNPAYPPIPDIMPAVGDVSQKVELELEDDNATKILPEVFDLLSNKTKNQTAHSEWLKANENQQKNESLINFTAGTLPEDLLNQRSPIDEDEASDTDVTTTEGVSIEVTTERVSEDIETKSEEKLLEEGAQLIAEVKISGDDMEPSTESPSIITIHSIIADKVKETEKVIGDTFKEAVSPETTSNNPKSVESLEVDSGELTTPKTNHSSMISNENASVETILKEGKVESPSESHDMTHSSGKEGSIELGSVEISVVKDVEMIGDSVKATTQGANIMKQDVELINVLNTPKPTKLAKVETSTYELLPTPEETKSRTIIKREITSDHPDDDVFKDLEKELDEESFQSSKNPEEERSEADHIFKELLDESDGKTSTPAKPKSEEQKKINDLSNALAGVALKGQLPDPNVFRLIGGLFGGKREE